MSSILTNRLQPFKTFQWLSEDNEYSLHDIPLPTSQPQLLQFFHVLTQLFFQFPPKALIFPLCSARSIPLTLSTSTHTIANSYLLLDFCVCLTFFFIRVAFPEFSIPFPLSICLFQFYIHARGTITYINSYFYSTSQSWKIK